MILAEDDGKVVSKELEADKPEDERTKGYNQVRNLKPRTKYWDKGVKNKQCLSGFLYHFYGSGV